MPQSHMSFDELWTSLSQGDESVLIEAKRGSEIGKSIRETISAFANEPDAGGGYLLLGVAETKDMLFPDYKVIGVENPDKLQCDLATQCRDNFSVVISPIIRIERVDNKSVLVAHIPEANAHDKPVFIKSRGVAKGSFRRIGSTDHVCCDDDLALFYQERGQETFDETVMEGTSFSDIDPEAILAYRSAKEQYSGEGSVQLTKLSDVELLYSLNATSEPREAAMLTLGGLVLFGSHAALRRKLPMTRVDYIRVDGREWVSDAKNRYQTIEKLGPLLITIPQLIAQILDDIPKSFSLRDGEVHRRDLPLIPREVIREAVVNSLMHRSYRNNQPVQIIRYANRIEIKNPGYSLIPEERLGDPGSKTRNPKIAATLHDAGLAETKGTGIRVMQDGMDTANLTSPLIVSDRKKDEFTLRLLVHHLLGEQDIKWLGRFKDCNLHSDEAKALIVLREMGYMDNFTYRSVNHVDSLAASKHLARLRDLNLLDQQGKGANTFYTAGSRISSDAPPSKKRKKRALRGELSAAERGELTTLRGELNNDLRESVDLLGPRASAEELNGIIHRLCSWKPLSGKQLALLLGRDEKGLTQRNIKRLMNEGLLAFYYPDQRNHPQQKYVPTEELPK